MLTLSLIATTTSCCVFSFGYLYFLGLRIIRTGINDNNSAFFMGSVVCSGILAAVVTLEAVLVISIAREVSGQLFYVASGIGIIVLVIATVGAITSSRYAEPFKVALAQRDAARWGLMIGNISLIIINALSFSGKLPSLL